MEARNSMIETWELDTFTSEILELYEGADESARVDLYMTFRELRDRFERLETERNRSQFHTREEVDGNQKSPNSAVWPGLF